MPSANSKLSGSTWAGYLFAALATAAVVGVRFELTRLIGIPVSLPLLGLAAVIGCVWWTSTGPAVVAAVLTTAWYVLDTRGSGMTVVQLAVHHAIYLAETGVVCFCGHQLRVAKNRAARGEDWQRHLVETSGEGIWMVDSAGVIGYANPRIAEMLGCEVRGRKAADFFFPEDLPMERIRFQNRRAGAREQFDRRLRRSDGTEVWTLACSSAWSGDGNEPGVLTMMTDITERKKAEQALRRSERRFRELFENIREGVYQTTPDGRILAANPELLRIVGFTSPEELNVPGVVRDTFVDLDVHRNLRERLERDGSYANVEFQLRTRDHRIITVRENARVVRDDSGQVLYYEGTLTDVTESLRLEKQLLQTQTAQALGRMAGGIARDFRTVGMSMMNGLQQVLQSLPSDHPARPRLEGVAKSMDGAKDLTLRILDFSQRLTTEQDALDVNVFVRRLEPTLIGLAGPENSVTLHVGDAPAPVLADPVHLQQIVTSFLIHARDFGDGVKHIEVNTNIEGGLTPGMDATEEGSRPSVAISVQQTTHRKAGDASTSKNEWIGMATSQAIIAQYGGSMTAETISGQGGESGIKCVIRLPLELGAKSLRNTSETPGLPLTAPDTPTVLLVEEEPLIRELSRDMLERQGFRVTACGNQNEARGIAANKGPFDVLIIALTTDSAPADTQKSWCNICPDLRLLFLVEPSDVSSGRALPPPGSAILQKPFSVDILGRKVRQLLDERRTAWS